MPTNKSARSIHHGEAYEDTHSIGEHRHRHGNRYGLQQQPRKRSHWPDIVADADCGQRDNGGEHDRQPPEFAIHAGIKNCGEAVIATVAATTAIPPPCGVGFLWDAAGVRLCQRIAAQHRLEQAQEEITEHAGGETCDPAKFEQPGHGVPVYSHQTGHRRRRPAAPPVIPNARATPRALTHPTADIASCAGR